MCCQMRHGEGNLLMFKLVTHPLDPNHLQEGWAVKTAGGFCTFSGSVREQNENRKVLALEYEAFHKLCESEGQKILQETCQKFSIIDARCFHRVGQLQVGEMAVWIGVAAAHRDAAFQACRYIIDEIKHRLPIWKKEFYADGDSGWINTGDQPPVISGLKDNS